MKIKIISILLFIPIIISSLMCGLMFGMDKNNIAYAEGVEVLQTLINPELSQNEMVTKYNVSSSEVSEFTPFNEETKTRMSGRSIVPTVSDSNQILFAEYNLSSNGGLGTENLSFGMWLYFSDITVHSLTLKFKVDENNYYKVEILKQQLVDILKQTNALSEQAFAWNYIEIPLSSAIIVGEVVSQGVLKQFSSIEISYTSTDIVEDSDFAAMRLYGLYLQNKSVNQIAATINQDYNIYSFNFWDEETRTSIVQGDTLAIMNRATAVDYAWVGDVNLCDDTTNNVTWEVHIKFPSNKTYQYRFGSNVTFSETGEYTVTYRAQIKDKNTEDVLIELYDFKSFVVRSDDLIYFNFNDYEVDAGKTIIISLQTDNTLDLSSLEILSIEVNVENITIEQVGNSLSWKIEGVKAGETDLVIKIKAKRNTNSVEREYTASTKLKVNAEAEDNKLTTYILLGILGLILIISIGFGVKTVVKDRKNDVK